MTNTSSASDEGWKSCSKRSRWTPGNIFLMIIGFIIWVPLGLAMLAYILWKEEIMEIFQFARNKCKAALESSTYSAQKSNPSGNSAFDAYRDKEMARLEEERAALDKMRAEFDQFMNDLRQARDREEFDRFLSEHGKDTN